MINQKELEQIVSLIGDNKLTVNEVHELNEVHSRHMIYRYLNIAYKQGLLQRESHKLEKSTGREYVYYKSDSKAKAVEIDELGEPFVLQVFCKSCGQDKMIKLPNHVSAIESSHSSMAWSCCGCGDYVRLYQCLELKELSRVYTTWIDKKNPDIEYGDAFVTLGR